MTNICFQGLQGWGPFHPAIVDTGAPISMFPKQIWQGAQFTAIGKLMTGGVVQRDECRISATLAQVSCLLSDGRESLGPLIIHAYLADSDQAPTLLGIADVLEQYSMWLDIRSDIAFLEAT